jgi:hypothetical protein
MNNIYDCLNTKSLFNNNQYNTTLNPSGAIKTFLFEALKYFLNLTKIKTGKKSKLPCFKGFANTINTILQFL